MARLTALSRRFDPLPVDEQVADSYGQLAAKVVGLDRQPRARVMDLLIAAPRPRTPTGPCSTPAMQKTYAVLRTSWRSVPRNRQRGCQDWG